MGFEKDYKNVRFCCTVARRAWKMNREGMMLNKQRSQVEKVELKCVNIKWGSSLEWFNLGIISIQVAENKRGICVLKCIYYKVVCNNKT